jgi:hypothetical protein
LVGDETAGPRPPLLWPSGGLTVFFGWINCFSGELVGCEQQLGIGPPDPTLEDIVAPYKALADIERAFRVIKIEIDIMPVFHRRPDRIRAQALICFLALILYRVLRMRSQ